MGKLSQNQLIGREAAMLECLAEGEQCLYDFAERVGAERSNISRRLSALVRAGTCTSRKEGLRMIYTLRTPCVLQLGSAAEAVLRSTLSEDRAMLESLESS